MSVGWFSSWKPRFRTRYTDEIWAWIRCHKSCWVRRWEKQAPGEPWSGELFPDMDVLGQYFLNLDNLAPGHQPFDLGQCVGCGGVWLGHTSPLPQPSSPFLRHDGQGRSCRRRWLCGQFPHPNFFAWQLASGGLVPPGRLAVVAAWPATVLQGTLGPADADLKGLLLFFWGFLTHIVLDCFTTYGTQVFAPFSDQRVAWGTISVAGTAPFLTCLLVASTCAKHDRRRAMWNGVGLGIAASISRSRWSTTPPWRKPWLRTALVSSRRPSSTTSFGTPWSTERMIFWWRNSTSFVSCVLQTTDRIQVLRWFSAGRTTALCR